MNTPKLQQAQELLKNKHYAQARQLLESIPTDPTAQKWLSKLDQIAPKNGDSDKLSQANLLLRQKKYAEARVILEDMPFDPMAQKWLDKLNEIAPKNTPKPTISMTQELDSLFAQQPATKTTTFTMPTYEPSVESVFEGSRTQLIDQKPDLNSLTKDEKEKLVYVHQLIQKKQFDRARQILQAMPNNMMAQNMLNDLNQIAKPKAQTGKTAALGVAAFFSFIFRSRLLLRLVVFVVVAIVAFVWGFLKGSPTYENAFLKLEYPKAWLERDLREIPMCSEAPRPCFVSISTQGENNWGFVAMTRISLTENQTIESVHPYFWEQFASSWDNPTLLGEKSLMIGGKKALAHEMELNHVDDKRHFMMIHVLDTAKSAIEILLWAEDAADFSRHYDDMMKILNSVEFKPA